jgi:hypothetical protein
MEQPVSYSEETSSQPSLETINQVCKTMSSKLERSEVLRLAKAMGLESPELRLKDDLCWEMIQRRQGDDVTPEGLRGEAYLLIDAFVSFVKGAEYHGEERAKSMGRWISDPSHLRPYMKMAGYIPLGNDPPSYLPAEVYLRVPYKLAFGLTIRIGPLSKKLTQQLPPGAEPQYNQEAQVSLYEQYLQVPYPPEVVDAGEDENVETIKDAKLVDLGEKGITRMGQAEIMSALSGLVDSLAGLFGAGFQILDLQFCLAVSEQPLPESGVFVWDNRDYSLSQVVIEADDILCHDLTRPFFEYYLERSQGQEQGKQGQKGLATSIKVREQMLDNIKQLNPRVGYAVHLDFPLPPNLRRGERLNQYLNHLMYLQRREERESRENRENM